MSLHLEDAVGPGLDVIFCGTAAGNVSARVGAPYAGPGNRFWPTLYSTGLTPRLLHPLEFRLAPAFGIGITNIAPHAVGMDHTLRREDFDPHFIAQIIKSHAPRAFAFNGKRAAQEFYRRLDLPYGHQPERIGATAIFVLPSTSGVAVRYWDESYWQ